MNLQSLLGEMPKSQFVEDYFFRLPFSLAGGSRAMCRLGTWELLGEILGHDGTDVMVVREGRQYAGPDPTTLAAARALSDEGYTILVRHAEMHHAELEQLAREFSDDFGAPVNIHIYATPAGTYGFSWHYDAEDVFIVQTTGKKEYSLRKNTVNPWPLVETIPDWMGYERETMPLMRVLLAAGDWLYIPCGWWHKADAPAGDEAAISLALGLMTRTAMDVYDFLRTQLLESLLWRQRLPLDVGAATSSADLASRYGELFESLAADLAERFRDKKFLLDFLQSRHSGAGRVD